MELTIFTYLLKKIFFSCGSSFKFFAEFVTTSFCFMFWFLVIRHVISLYMDRGLNPHALTCKVKS